MLTLMLMLMLILTTMATMATLMAVQSMVVSAAQMPTLQRLHAPPRRCARV
jgi:hypothetical protein